jgi:hypothetical protein
MMHMVAEYSDGKNNIPEPEQAANFFWAKQKSPTVRFWVDMKGFFEHDKHNKQYIL